MFRDIKQFFDRHILSAGKGRGAETQHALRVATAALLYEVMRTDGELKDVERHAVEAAIRSSFDLTAGETGELLRLAEVEAREATDYFQFATLIDRHFNPEQKTQVVENLWRVAAADLEIDRFERTLVHKIADLLHVPRATQIAARERALRAAHERPPR
jgi:uncharacterized tellurite resistance protein B-like protein